MTKRVVIQEAAGTIYFHTAGFELCRGMYTFIPRDVPKVRADLKPKFGRFIAALAQIDGVEKITISPSQLSVYHLPAYDRKVLEDLVARELEATYQQSGEHIIYYWGSSLADAKLGAFSR